MLQSEAPPGDSIVCGLKNLGNSCYANVIIQVLVNQRNFLYALSHSKVVLNNGVSAKSFKSLKSFVELVQSMQAKEHITPSNFLADAVSLSPDDFSMSQQGDACEFLQVLLSKWEEVFKKVVSLLKVYNLSIVHPCHVLLRKGEKEPPAFTDEMLMLRLFKQREDLLSSTKHKKKADDSRLHTALGNMSRRMEVPDELLRACTTEQSFLLSRENVITDLFQGCTVTVFTCVECQSSRISNPESFTVLSLPMCASHDFDCKISHKNSSVSTRSDKSQLLSRCKSLLHLNERSSDEFLTISLIDCLNKFCSASIIDLEGSCTQCTFCDRMQEKIQQRSFFLRLPEILIVSFKRFSFDTSWISSKGYGSKRTDHVHCPMTLDLGDFCTSVEYVPDKISAVGNSENVHSRVFRNDNIYMLDSVVNHHGESLRKGHYTCYAYKPDIQKWGLFNDHHVGEVPFEEVEASEVYVAVYKKTFRSQTSRFHDVPESCGTTRHNVIRLLPSMKVQVSEETFHERVETSFAMGVELIRNICHVIENSTVYRNTKQRSEGSAHIRSAEKICQDENVLSIPDSSIQGRVKKVNSAGRRLLSIDWLRASYCKCIPGPITNLPCYCCPDEPIGKQVSGRHSPTVSQMDQVFSNLCEYIKMANIDQSSKAWGKSSYFQYFRGEQRRSHGMSISETYVEVSADIFTTLQSQFGGGPELCPCDLLSMSEHCGTR